MHAPRPPARPPAVGDPSYTHSRRKYEIVSSAKSEVFNALEAAAERNKQLCQAAVDKEKEFQVIRYSLEAAVKKSFKLHNIIITRLGGTLGKSGQKDSSGVGVSVETTVGTSEATQLVVVHPNFPLLSDWLSRVSYVTTPFQNTGKLWRSYDRMGSKHTGGFVFPSTGPISNDFLALISQ